MPSVFEFVFLGTFSLKVNGRSVDIDSWLSKKALNLLKYLAFYSGKKFSRDFLLELFWPGDCEISNLHAAISFIRRKLREYTNNCREMFINYSQGYYYLDKTKIKSIDCQQLEALYQEGLILEVEKVDEALEKYREALALYKDHFLIDDIYEDWTMSIREYYQDIYAQLVINTGKILAKRNNYKEAIEVCKRSLKYQLYNEEIYYLLIRLLMESGRTLEATRYYQEYSRHIGQEFGLEPGQKFNILFEGNSKLFIPGSLGYRSISSGPFFCNRELFILLYKLALKRSKRYKEYFSLIHIEIRASLLNEIKQYLFHICRKKLREGDIFCLWNEGSILLLVHRADEDDSFKIRDRLLDNIPEIIREKLLIEVIDMENIKELL